MRRVLLGLAFGVVLGVSATRVLSDSGPTETPTPGNVMTGQDFGFRVLKVEDRQVVGHFVVRVKGEWRAAEEPTPLPRAVPAKP